LLNAHTGIVALTDSMRARNPKFSVVVATRARLPQLQACLHSIANLRYPREQFEVVVVNDGSPPLPEGALRAFRDRLDVRCIDQLWAGPAAARNNGASHARGELIAFTDDDCTVAPDWLTVFEQALREQPEALVGGSPRNAVEADIFASASQLLVDYLYEYYHSRTDSRGPRFFSSNNMCARADLLRQLGPFDTSFRLPAGEDRDLCDRWTFAGRPLRYCPQAIVHHWHRMSLRPFTRQHLNYGRGAMVFHAARARRQNSRLRIEPLRFYAGLVTYPLSKVGGIRGALLVALLGWSQVMNAVGYFLEKAKSRRGGKA